MRLKITLESADDFIILPIHYNKAVQAMLYYNLPPELSDFFHNVGFFHKKRKFKLFTFSKINSERFRLFDGNILFKSPVTLTVSSAISDMIQNLGQNFITEGYIKLAKNKLEITQISVIKEPEFTSDIIIQTLSPITVYRTIPKENGKKFTEYYSVGNPEFIELIKENIRKKYEIITGNTLNDFNFNMYPLGKIKNTPMKYGNTFIKGVEGRFKIISDPTIIKTVYDAGLGSKNSQGFGMINKLNVMQ